MNNNATVRLTMAQAVIRFLKTSTANGTASSSPSSPAASASSATATWPDRPGAAADTPTSATTRPATSRPWCTRAAAFAKQQQPPADVGLHHVHRPGRHQHGHRRGHGHHQPPARAAAARRHLRAAQCGPGAPAARIGPQPGHLGQRLLQAGQPLLGSHQPPRPDSSPRCPRPCAC